ncbi:multidrug ABC transporter substrate-binding protein [bacterium (Candidatus Torokbacteria) CG09_land_8_20_14_0_10_42_11]|nr:MAG: multidrug ABC transporter substrate-binding protein [bacterium (Candidatus Torokbacteria) CG09_land_8_20_14_0_10_42_11]
MLITDLFQETFSALLLNKARSGLTVLGIVIGIGSVIAMIAIGQGSQEMIQSNIQSLGSNLIIVMPGVQRGIGFQVSQGRGSSQTLTREDADAIASEISSVKAVAPELSSRYQVTAKKNNTNTQVAGATAAYPAIRNVKIDSGSFISDQNVKSMAKVAVLGPQARDDLFGENADPLGQMIRIKQINFKVIGVTAAKGGSGFSNQDDMIFIPLTTAGQFLSGANYVSTISVQAASENAMAETQQQISALLLARHNIADSQLADFSILNQTDIVETASQVASTFTTLLGSVAAISLIVGGIGIMNMMLTTVTERTREIGLRKAIGAKKNDINLQFLTEAIILTFSGGVIGAFLGWLVSLGMSRFGGITTQVSLSSILLAFCVSSAIGIIFGYYPARRAAGLKPIEALRYE